MTNTRTAAATAAASRARSVAALERKLRAAATLLALNGWYLANPEDAPDVRHCIDAAGARSADLEWSIGDDVR